MLVIALGPGCPWAAEQVTDNSRKEMQTPWTLGGIPGLLGMSYKVHFTFLNNPSKRGNLSIAKALSLNPMDSIAFLGGNWDCACVFACVCVQVCVWQPMTSTAFGRWFQPEMRSKRGPVGHQKDKRPEYGGGGSSWNEELGWVGGPGQKYIRNTCCVCIKVKQSRKNLGLTLPCSRWARGRGLSRSMPHTPLAV